MTLTASYIIAARRSAIGKIGGLHALRRVEAVAAPVIEAVLKDTMLDRNQIDEVIVGNTTGGGSNPARLISVAAGIPPNVPAYTVDRQCASGLEAVLSGTRLVATGGARIVLAGGAESPSTAPWRVAKPRSLYQLPRIVEGVPFVPAENGDSQIAEMAEDIAQRFKISRQDQDLYAVQSHQKAVAAQNDKRFVGEIVPFRVEAKEARDETPRAEISLELLAQMPAFFPPDGTVTSGNCSSINDAAAFAVIVDEEIYNELGRPPALKSVVGAATGLVPEDRAVSQVQAVEKLFSQTNGKSIKDVGLIELSETFASQAIASMETLGLDEDKVNRDGGAIALGHPFGAASAVMVTRLFSQMVRQRSIEPNAPELGLATMGTTEGLGVAALFEAVG